MPKQPSIIFMGTPDFAVPTLKALAETYSIVGVYTQPPRPAGRGKHLQKSAVHQCAELLGLAVYSPVHFKDEQSREILRSLKPDLIVVVAYGLILPQSVLDIPPYGCLNIHGSILPRWRGAAPIQRAIVADDSVTGVTIMKMDAGMDTGPVLAEEKISIDISTTADYLTQDLSQRGAALLLDTIPNYINGSIQPKIQSEIGVTYASKIDKKELKIDWQDTATMMERKIRAFGSIWFPWHQDRIKILKASVDETQTNFKPGTILDNQLTFSCRGGILKPQITQKTGGKSMTVTDFLRGNPIPSQTYLPDMANDD